MTDACGVGLFCFESMMYIICGQLLPVNKYIHFFWKRTTAFASCSKFIVTLTVNKLGGRHFAKLKMGPTLLQVTVHFLLPK